MVICFTAEALPHCVAVATFRLARIIQKLRIA
ncbi:hypothetical protein BH09MYX1_BH09MYX1_31100 [soil metagenome]